VLRWMLQRGHSSSRYRPVRMLGNILSRVF
jgi:hypothetical protein